MFTQSYSSTIKYAAKLAPGLDTPSVFIKWAEDVADLLSYIFGTDYDVATQDLFEAAKEYQDE